MKDHLDERQYQIELKIAYRCFIAMYIACAALALIGLIAGSDLKSVLGETAVLVIGGCLYLFGIVKNGLWTSSKTSGEKNSDKMSILRSLIGSILCSAVFSVFYGIAISRRAGGSVSLGMPIGFFFIGITLLCFLTLFLLGKFSKREAQKLENKYED